MELQDIVNMLVNNSVSVAIIAYFCVRDWRFMDTLNKALITLCNSTDSLIKSTDSLKDLIREKEK